jgi:hypothetical protein
MYRTILIFSSLLSWIHISLAQCYENRHTTNAFDGWISCTEKNSPSNHGLTHWIKYDFGQSYPLHDVVFWNLNHPEYADDGIKDVIIEYSMNGTTWNLFDTVTIPRAPLSGFYEGVWGPDLGGINARYLLLTALNNYGGGCYGLSEIKVFTSDQQPNEFELPLSPCEGDGILKNISGGMELNGIYSGPGVSDNGNGTFNFDAGAVGPGNYLIQYTYAGGTLSANITVLPCDNPQCINCPQCGKFEPGLVNTNPIPEDIYHDAELSAQGTVGPVQPVNFRGAQSVNLEPGFEVQSNTSFLAEIRECNVNKVINPGFENDGNEWGLYVNSSATANVSYITTDPFEETKCAKIEVTSVVGTAWHVQLIQDGHSITQGKKYEITFYAKADSPAQFTMYAQMDYSPYTAELIDGIMLTEDWQKYTYRFTASQTLDGNFNGGLRINPNCGEFTGTFYFDKFMFAEID